MDKYVNLTIFFQHEHKIYRHNPDSFFAKKNLDFDQKKKIIWYFEYINFTSLQSCKKRRKKCSV